jgi:hypothetical protein
MVDGQQYSYAKTGPFKQINMQPGPSLFNALLLFEIYFLLMHDPTILSKSNSLNGLER